jgi:ketosteroid isomerase-like protein
MWVFMISQEHAERLAHECGEAWNRHDLNGIMAHYADEIVFTSTFVPILESPPRRCEAQPKYAQFYEKPCRLS